LQDGFSYDGTASSSDDDDVEKNPFGVSALEEKLVHEFCASWLDGSDEDDEGEDYDGYFHGGAAPSSSERGRVWI